MLNEKLKDITRIGHHDILVLMLSRILHGTDSAASLQQLLYTLSGTPLAEFKTSIVLLEAMGLVQIEGDYVSPSVSLIEAFKDKNEDDYNNIFSKLYIDYVIRENVLVLDTVEYDFTIDTYRLPRKCIKLCYAAYRNLLIEMGVLTPNMDGSYLVNDILFKIISKPNYIVKKTLERLKLEIEREEEIGEEGEQFVLKYEKERVGSKAQDKVKQISHIDVSAGFDIVSVMDEHSKQNDRFIEVKTYIGTPHFHLSRNEKLRAEILGEHYYIYLVNYNKIQKFGYKPEMIQDPIHSIFESEEWTNTIESYLIEKKPKKTDYSETAEEEQV